MELLSIEQIQSRLSAHMPLAGPSADNLAACIVYYSYAGDDRGVLAAWNATHQVQDIRQLSYRMSTHRVGRDEKGNTIMRHCERKAAQSRQMLGLSESPTFAEVAEAIVSHQNTRRRLAAERIMSA
jgi:hypothetical protein